MKSILSCGDFDVGRFRQVHRSSSSRLEFDDGKMFGSIRDFKPILFLTMPSYGLDTAQIVGQLRYEYALNLIQKLGVEFTRIGLDFSAPAE